MNFYLSRLKQIRWYQWLLAALVLIYIIYIALSFMYLPNKLKQVVKTDVSDLIGRDIDVERFDFNPFVLSLKVDRLSIADKPGKPLVGCRQLMVNFSFWKSVFQLEIALDELAIDQPEINIEKHGDRFNFSDIIERFNSGEVSEKTSEKQPGKNTRVALGISNTTVKQGIFRFADFSGKKPTRSSLDNITISVKDIYLATGDEQLNPFNLQAKLHGGGDINLSGLYRIDPLHVDAEVVVKEVHLATFSDFVENIFPIKVSNGLLSVSTKILARQETELQLQVDQCQVRVNALALDDDVMDPPMLRSESIRVSDVALDFLKKNVTVGSVSLDGITANQWLDKAGKFRYEQLVPGKTLQQEPAGQKVSPPWNILIKKVGLKNSLLNFTDKNDEITVGHSLSEISLNLENITLASGGQTSMQFGAVLDENGRINVDGTLTLSPFSTNLNYQIGEIPLPGFSEYIETASFLRIEKGSLSLNGSASLGAEDSTALKAGLDMTLNGLQVGDTHTGKPLINLDAFKLDDIQVDMKNRKISIASVGLMKPEVLLERSQDKQINLAGLIKQKEAVPPSAEPDKESKTKGAGDWTFLIEKIEMQDGNVLYADKSVKPLFKTGLYNLAVEVGQIASNREEPTPFSLTGKIDKYAPFNVKGTLSPLEKQPGFTFHSELKGLEMPGLSPYTAVFIGNNLKSGKLSLTLDYDLQDRKIKGKNHIVAENLYLGEKVPSETATKAPVGLGLALLRDVNGIIDLNVGVSGALDDPGFSISGIVLKALVNIIVKAAVAPFKLLGALIGGREDLGEINFTEGLAGLTQDNQDRLKQLVKALKEKPQLAVKIKGNAGKQEDTAMLQILHLQKRVAAVRKITTAELKVEAGKKTWWMVPENRYVLGKINKELNLPGILERVKKLKTKKPDLKGKALEAEVYRLIYEDVKGAQRIGTNELLLLADSRALSIKQYLVDVLRLDHKRVSVTKAPKGELTGLVTKLEIKAM